MAISELEAKLGRLVPIKLWTPLHEVESSALDQLKNIASLPQVFHHVAVMPDVHYGKGATVGSVIALKDAISPAAVGVDIGCFTGDTEVILSDSLPHRLDSLSGEFVVYSATPDGKVVAAKARAVKTRSNAPLVSVLLDTGKTIRCTPDHEFMLRDGTYLKAENLSPGTSLMPFNGSLDKEGYFQIEQPFSGRKQRSHWILARSGILGNIPRFEGQKTIIHHKDFNKANNNPDNLMFMGDADHSSFHRKIVENNRHWQSPEFEERRVKALAAKALTPEGHAFMAARGTRNIKLYMETHPGEFKAAVSGNGVRGALVLSSYNVSDRGRAKSKEISNRRLPCPECNESIKSPIGLFNHRKNKHGIAGNHKVISVTPILDVEDVYCLQVPGYNNFALAAGVFVHNCGMAAVKTSLKASDLPDDLKDIRHQIERDIPTGFSEHKDYLKFIAKLPLWNEFTSLHPEVQDRMRKAYCQIGTLGGGNHFIEICLDTTQNVWLMLHSGSRNIGKTLAGIHMNIAKDLGHNATLKDKDLATFLSGTPEMAAYRHDLMWAQEYAFENRRAMLKLFKDALRRFFPEIAFGEEILCHHNYVSDEIHFGERVLVTRKGAINAEAGRLGIIPGSMGAKSFIVKGLGNPESFNSASHGAGRRMSRGAAKRTFTVDDLKKQTEGVECKKDSTVLDEIPGAYKDIETVMSYQADLVEIVAELKQVLCVKG